MTFLLNWLFTSIAIAIADWFVPGTVEPWLCYIFTGLFLSLVNSLVKPIITVLALPLTIITLGLFQLMVNGLMLQLASSLSLNLLGSGIVAANFVSAFVGAIIVSIMCTILGVKKH